MVEISKKMVDKLNFYKNLTKWEISALKTREIKNGDLIFNEIAISHTTYWTKRSKKKACLEH
jgi:hypothetical protein